MLELFKFKELCKYSWCDFEKWFSFFCHNNNNVDDDKLDKALYKKIKTLISKKASLIESKKKSELNIFLSVEFTFPVSADSIHKKVIDDEKAELGKELKKAYNEINILLDELTVLL